MAGSILDFVGVLVVASGVFRWSRTGHTVPSDDPQVGKELKETRALGLGMTIILIGFACQLAGTWL